MLTVERDGWEAVRAACWRRQGFRCAAVSMDIFGSDVSSQDCAAVFGRIVLPTAYEAMEFDHVTQNGVRLDDEAHGLMVCARHHRLSIHWRTDSKVHRAAARAWLARHFPEVWDAGS